jgi:peroxiredoxin
MRNQTDTLRVGEPAPKFTLAAANREGDFSLADLVCEGPVAIEFLRGTW